ncbi:MAG: bifunctional adenosylcobinamide kinase/adenosylcobinamide-phosphate guanylyltransferase [Huintestinicola sp.]
MLILVTGGSKCGKSAIAEDILSAYSGPKYYIATMEPYGEEARIAIERHRKMRMGKGFSTIEQYTDIRSAPIDNNGAVLIECIGNLLANEMFTAHSSNPSDAVVNGVLSLASRSEAVCAVTNQVGEDGMDYPPETMEYIRLMGDINRRLAENSDIAIEAVCGIPLMLKGEKPRCLL